MITWLASYPKSGNTWARLFLQAYGADAQLDINERSGPVWHDADSKVWKEVLKAKDDAELDAYPEWEYHCHRGAVLMRFVKHYAKDRDGQVWLKTHIPRWNMDGLEMIPAGMTRGAVYIVRDPRDVVISFADHLGISIDHTIDFMAAGNSQLLMNGKRENIGSWSLNVGSWIDDACPFPRCVLRYEDMLTDPEASFTLLLKAFGIPAETGRLRRAIEHTAFDVLRTQEDAAGTFINVSEHQDRFFRSGKAGAWRNVLSPEQAARIEADHGDVMRCLGYTLEARAAA